MANEKKGPKMDPKVVKRLLDGLTQDEGFRKRFEEHAPSALESIGYVAPAEDDEAAAAGQCLMLQPGESLAAAEDIERDRAKLQESLVGIFAFTCPAQLTR